MKVEPITSLSQIGRLGTILGVWAHPDDGTFTCGGLLAWAVRNGQRVVCITATKGEKGSQDEAKWPLKTLAETRARELTKALKILGIKEHVWLNYCDGECHCEPSERAASRIQQFIDIVKPDTVLTFGPDGLTGHTDHQSVSTWTKLAIAQSRYKPKVYHAVDTIEMYASHLKKVDDTFNIYFNIDQPNLVPLRNCDIRVLLDETYMNKKIRALKVMPSQTEAIFNAFNETWLKEAFSIETFVRAGN